MAVHTEERHETRKTTAQFNLVSTLTTVVALVGIFYAVGLVFFIFQLGVTFALDFATALHAASLVSQIVVLGQGLRVLVVPTFLFTAVILPAFLVYVSPNRVQKILQEAERENETGKQIRRPRHTSQLMTFARKLSRILMPIAFIVFVLFPMVVAVYQGDLRQLVSLIIQCIVGVVIGLALFFTAYEGRSWFWRLSVSLGILFSGSLLAAVVGGQLDQPPLPSIQLQSQGQQIQGTLLVHLDGHWYVFVEPSKSLRVIPDNAAENITVSP